jgi:hypothetical protein
MLESPITFGGFTFNDQSKRSLEVSPFYWAEVKSVDGLFGADISTESHPIPNATGERSGDFFRRGKTLTVSGILWARNVHDMRVGQLAIESALWSLEPSQFRFTFWGQPQVYLMCRVVQDVAMGEEQVDDKARRRFTFALRADDPRMRRVDNNASWPNWRT